MDLLALRGRPQPLKKPSQSQKGHFYKKMNAVNDTKTPELSKSAEGNGEYLWSSVAFVEAWIKSKSRNANTGLKTTQMLHKNKACTTLIFMVVVVVWYSNRPTPPFLYYGKMQAAADAKGRESCIDSTFLKAEKNGYCTLPHTFSFVVNGHAVYHHI